MFYCKKDLVIPKKQPFFSHTEKRFMEVAKTGSQKVLWTMLNNLSRDWYYFLCREFGMDAKPVVVGFLPEDVSKDRHGDHTYFCHGEFPQVIIATHRVRFALNSSRVFPESMYWDTIPHEICHAIASQYYLNEIPYKEIDHEKPWQEFMAYVGLPTTKCSKFYAEEISQIRMYSESVSADLMEA